MLRVVQVTKDNKDAEGLRQTYEAAFPKEERVPYDEHFNLPEALVADVKAYYIWDTFIAIFVAYVLKKFNYPAYLAVVENLRNKGYGKTILTEVLFHYTNDKPFLVDVESPLQKDAPNLEIRKTSCFLFAIRNNGHREILHCKWSWIYYYDYKQRTCVSGR